MRITTKKPKKCKYFDKEFLDVKATKKEWNSRKFCSKKCFVEYGGKHKLENYRLSHPSCNINSGLNVRKKIYGY